MKLTSLSRLVLVAFFLEMGVVLIFVPWSTYWDRNYFLEVLPFLGPFLQNNFVRGAISGVGAVNVALGVLEIFSWAGSSLRHRHASPGLTPPADRGSVRPSGSGQESVADA